SEYVKFEVACVEKHTHVTKTTIDLSLHWDDQVALIDELLPKATSFVSYAKADRARVQPYIDYLIKQDLAVFDPTSDIRPGEAWQS
ncbi:hypothetical protein ABTE96_21360, partial [Acinetobacter baumannii]